MHVHVAKSQSWVTKDAISISYWIIGTSLTIIQACDLLCLDGHISTLKNPNGGWSIFYPNSATYGTTGPSPLPQVRIWQQQHQHLIYSIMYNVLLHFVTKIMSSKLSTIEFLLN